MKTFSSKLMQSTSCYWGLAALLAGSITATASAQQAAHVHGIGALNLAVEGTTIEIELITPADDLVGFEHQPATEAQEHAVTDAVSKLNDGRALFTLADAECTLSNVTIASALIDGHEAHDDHHHDDEKHHDEEHHDEDHDEDKAAGHAEHDEEHHHDDEKHHDEEEHHDEEAHHDHDHDDTHADDEEVHSEFHAHYVFDCAAATELHTVSTRYFESFPRAQSLRATALTASGQYNATLSASSPEFRFE